MGDDFAASFVKGVAEMDNNINIEHFEALLKLAEALAKVAHEGQVDKVGRPYFLHPKAVSENCNTIYGKIVGWLHDVVEDTSVTCQDLLSIGFDDFLVEAVCCVTKEKGYDLDNYYKRIKNNPIAKEVKLADLKHNTDPSRIPEDANSDFKKKMAEKYKKYQEYIAYLNS